MTEKETFYTNEGDYKVQLDIFQGPIELLLHLIRKNKINIFDIEISTITNQYLNYLEFLKAINIDLSADFLVMASTLIYIKSTSLLPVHNPKDDNSEDPRMEIVRPILEYLRLKAAAKDLSERNKLEDDVFVRSPETDLEFEYQPEELISVDILELFDAFQNLLTMMPDDSINVIKKGISIKERISQLIDILEDNEEICFHELFKKDYTKSDMIVTFLALLEMVKLNIVVIVQEAQSGVIKIVYI